MEIPSVRRLTTVLVLGISVLATACSSGPETDPEDSRLIAQSAAVAAPAAERFSDVTYNTSGTRTFRDPLTGAKYAQQCAGPADQDLATVVTYDQKAGSTTNWEVNALECDDGQLTPEDRPPSQP